MTLNSYNDLAIGSTLNVNLLTTLAYQRVRNPHDQLGHEVRRREHAGGRGCDGDGLVGKFEFQVPDASPATFFPLPTAIISNLAGKSIMASAVGQLSASATRASHS